MIITVTAPSGVGKTSLIKAYHDAAHTRHMHFDVQFLTSTTTRSPRATDLHFGNSAEYEYVTEDEFERLRKQGKFLQVYGDYGNRYATRLARLDEALRKPGTLFLAAVFVPAAEHIFKYAFESGRSGKVKTLFLDLASEEERVRRLHERGETNQKRFEPELVRWRDEAKKTDAPFQFVEADVPAPDLVRKVHQKLFGHEIAH